MCLEKVSEILLMAMDDWQKLQYEYSVFGGRCLALMFS
jgi:hypothetical protein